LLDTFKFSELAQKDFYLDDLKAASLILPSLVEDLKEEKPRESLGTPTQDEIRIGSWNMNHFNNSYKEDILDCMAEIIREHHVVVLIEVSKDATLNNLKQKLGGTWEHTKLVDMKRIFKPRTSTQLLLQNSGFQTCVFYNSAVLDVVEAESKMDPTTTQYQKYWIEQSYSRKPIAWKCQLKKKKKTPLILVAVHLKSADATKCEEEIYKLPLILNNVRTEKGLDIFLGDFNMSVFQKLPKIKGWEFLSNLSEGTMTSLKSDRSNDNFLIGSASGCYHPNVFIAKPKLDWKIPVEDLLVVRRKDYNRLLNPLFTDHWPITLSLNLFSLK